MQILNFMSPWRHGVLGRDSIAVNRHHGNPYKQKKFNWRYLTISIHYHHGRHVLVKEMRIRHPDPQAPGNELCAT